jgi:hypothetical protein
VPDPVTRVLRNDIVGWFGTSKKSRFALRSHPRKPALARVQAISGYPQQHTDALSESTGLLPS